MRVPKKRPATSNNVVEGFSQRFNLLMDRARFPARNRISLGAEHFDVVHNTFKAWCTADRIPGTYSLLVHVVHALLKDIPERYNPKAVVAWLLAGEAVPDPFEDNTDMLVWVELYRRVFEVAKNEGMDFDKLPREVRNVILRRVRANVPDENAKENFEFDNGMLSMVVGMLVTARAMS